MKKIIIFAVLLASGSLFYYYVLFLSQQNIKSQQDINAIRNVIAPSPEQQKINQQRAVQSEKVMKDYLNCQMTWIDKSSAYIQKACPAVSYNYLDHRSDSPWNKCISNAQNSAEYKKLECPKPY